jgi:LPXTG-motif cell wall-anchored protein
MVDGEEWRFDVTAAPQPLYLGLSILANGAFDPLGSMCVATGEESIYALDGNDGDHSAVGQIATLNADGETLHPFFGDNKALPDIERFAPAVEEPVLPATGADVAGTVGLAAAFIGLGVLGGYLRRRESRA